jgi:hypothetical protein
MKEFFYFYNNGLISGHFFHGNGKIVDKGTVLEVNKNDLSKITNFKTLGLITGKKFIIFDFDRLENKNTFEFIEKLRPYYQHT